MAVPLCNTLQQYSAPSYRHRSLVSGPQSWPVPGPQLSVLSLVLGPLFSDIPASTCALARALFQSCFSHVETNFKTHSTIFEIVYGVSKYYWDEKQCKTVSTIAEKFKAMQFTHVNFCLWPMQTKYSHRIPYL